MMKKIRTYFICLLTLFVSSLHAQSLNIKGPVSAKMSLVKTREVIRPSKKPKLETLMLDITLGIKPQDEQNFVFTWKIEDLSEKYKGIPKGDRDNYKKYLKGAKLTYEVDKQGRILGFTELTNSKRKIQLDTEELLEDYFRELSSTEEEEMKEEEDIEDWLSDIFEELYYIEFLSFVDKYHQSLSRVMPKDNPSFSKGKFDKSIAKEQLASKREITYKEVDNVLVYKENESLDFEGCQHIFEKEEAAFRPFKKEYINQLFTDNQIVPKKDLEVSYNLEDGLIYQFLETRYYRFTTKEYFNKLEIKLVPQN